MINVLPNPDFVRVCEIDYYRETYESSLPFRPKCSRALRYSLSPASPLLSFQPLGATPHLASSNNTNSV
jgi:hypothetical protein